MTTAAQQTFLIVGAGLAGAKTAEAETVRALSKPSQAPAHPGVTPATRGDL
jgi:hypothetical protein